MKAGKFFAILLCIGILYGGVLYTDMHHAAPSLVYASDSRVENVVDEVLSYVEQERENDPLVEFEPGVWVKTSNVKGINIDGETYYYTLLPHMSFDPVARGKVSENDVNIVYKDDDSDFPIVIYQLKK